MIRRGASPSVSSFSCSRGLESPDAGLGLRPGAVTSQVDALQRLVRTANSDQSSGSGKAKRVQKLMELAAVRPRFVRSGPTGCG
jgi:hypothetical protein